MILVSGGTKNPYFGATALGCIQTKSGENAFFLIYLNEACPFWLAELVRLQTQTRERRDKEREREVNKEYLGNNNQTSLKVHSVHLSRHLNTIKSGSILLQCSIF